MTDLYTATYDSDKQLITIDFNADAMHGCWPPYFDDGLHNELLERIKAFSDECIRKAYSSGIKKSTSDSALDLAIEKASSKEAAENT